MDAQSPTPRESFFTRRSLIAGLLWLLGVNALLWLMGRQFISDAGFGLWTGAWTKQTSQWIVDPYSTSHVLHGVFFYWLLLPLARWVPLSGRVLIAVMIESGWELLENSPIIIERYRANTASLDYFGDSILNSNCDILCALFGFWLAWRFGWKWMIALILAVELLMLIFVRDNLTLNILMLIHPSEAIKSWQMGPSPDGGAASPAGVQWPTVLAQRADRAVRARRGSGLQFPREQTWHTIEYPRNRRVRPSCRLRACASSSFAAASPGPTWVGSWPRWAPTWSRSNGLRATMLAAGDRRFGRVPRPSSRRSTAASNPGASI